MPCFAALVVQRVTKYFVVVVVTADFQILIVPHTHTHTPHSLLLALDHKENCCVLQSVYCEDFVLPRCRTKEPVTSLVQQMLQQWSNDRSRTFVFGFYENSLLKLVVPDETSEISDGSHIRVQPVSRDVTSVHSDVRPDWTQPDSAQLRSDNDDNSGTRELPMELEDDECIVAEPMDTSHCQTGICVKLICMEAGNYHCITL